ncbi:hypothetical protein ACWDUX_30070 [Streptomyces sp. NPDC003444]
MDDTDLNDFTGTSKWAPGTRVRVITPDEETHGWEGVVTEVSYAARMKATAVILDAEPNDPAVFYFDRELEAAA